MLEMVEAARVETDPERRRVRVAVDSILGSGGGKVLFGIDVYKNEGLLQVNGL